jgi:hypothetical protein
MVQQHPQPLQQRSKAMSSTETPTRDQTGLLVEGFVKMRKAQERAQSAEHELHFMIGHYQGAFDSAEYARLTQQWEDDYEAGRVRFAGMPKRS